MKMKLKTERPSNLVQAVLMGAGVGIAAILLGTLLVTYLIHTEKITLHSVNVGAILIQFIASLLCSFIAAKRMGGKYAMVCAVNGLALVVLLMAGALLISDSFNRVWQGILAVALGSIAACVLCLFTDRKTNHVKRRSR